MVNLITFAENCQKYPAQESQWKRVQTSEFVISCYIWFKLSGSRRGYYEEVQRKLGLLAHKLLNHVESR